MCTINSPLANHTHHTYIPLEQILNMFEDTASLISGITNHGADNLCKLLSVRTKQHGANPISKTTNNPDVAKVNDIVEEVKSQQLTSDELSKIAEGIEEEGDVVRHHEECARQHGACARRHEESARQLKCAAYVCRVVRTLSKAGATERQIECIGRNALDGCLEELAKIA